MPTTPKRTQGRAERANEKNPAIPIWFVIHNVAMWSGGLFWAGGQHGWAIGLGAFGLWSLVWVVGLMFGTADDEGGD